MAKIAGVKIGDFLVVVFKNFTEVYLVEGFRADLEGDRDLEIRAKPCDGNGRPYARRRIADIPACGDNWRVIKKNEIRRVIKAAEKQKSQRKGKRR